MFVCMAVLVMVFMMSRAVEIFHVMIVIFVRLIQNDVKVTGVNAGFINPGYFYPISVQIQAV